MIHRKFNAWRVGREAMLGWVGLAVGIAAYEIIAPPGQLLSEGVDRALLRNPNATRFAVMVVTLHLLNLLPHQIDPLNRIGSLRAITVRGRLAKLSRDRTAGRKGASSE